MKKKILLCSFLALGLFSFAQDSEEGALTSKNGINILPETGEFGLGVNALPILNHISFTGIGFGGTNFAASDNMIYGKYFMNDSKTAFRAKLRIADRKQVTNGYVVRQGQVDPEDLVTDTRTTNFFETQLSVGMEMRRGKSRVQGIYGAEVSVMYASGSSNYDYANKMGGQHISPMTSNFNGGSNDSSDRILSSSNSGVGFGANAFVGVEYFIAPKLSIGAEFTWGFMYTMTGEGVQTNEQYDAGNVVEREYKSASSNDFNLDTGDGSAAINLMFYF